MKKILMSLIWGALLTAAVAQTATRNVLLSWGASTSSGIVGYNVFRAATSTGPFTTPLNATPLTGLTFTDTTAVVGQTYTYAVAALGTPCTPTTPVGTACGSSAPTTATTTVPAQPGGVVTVVVSIQ